MSLSRIFFTRFSAFILLPLVILGGGSAQACELAPGRHVMNALLNLDLDAAKSSLNDWKRRDSNDPMLGFYAALTTLSIGYIESGHDQAFRKKLGGKALKQLKKVVSRTDDAVLEGTATPRQRLAYGMAQAFSSVLHTLREEMIRSYSKGKEGRRVLDELVAEHPEITDPYLVLGLFEYYVGILPEDMKWKARMLGLEGDAGLGVSYLEQAIQTAPATGPEAARALLMDLELPEEEQCRYRSLARMMRDAYPTNTLFPVYVRVYDMQCRIAELEGRAISEDMPISLSSGCM